MLNIFKITKKNSTKHQHLSSRQARPQTQSACSVLIALSRSRWRLRPSSAVHNVITLCTALDERTSEQQHTDYQQSDTLCSSDEGCKQRGYWEWELMTKDYLWPREGKPGCKISMIIFKKVSAKSNIWAYNGVYDVNTVVHTYDWSQLTQHLPSNSWL